MRVTPGALSAVARRSAGARRLPWWRVVTLAQKRAGLDNAPECSVVVGGDFGSWRSGRLAWSSGGVFAVADVLVNLSFAAAEARLAELARGGLLTQQSEGAYRDGLTGLVRVGPLGAAPGLSKLAEVHLLDPVGRGDSAVLALRWEATGPGGGLVPVLDADIALTPAGRDSTRLSLTGSYRPPFGAVGAALDRAILHKVADATIASLLTRVADALVHPQDPPDGRAKTGTGSGSPSSSPATSRSRCP